MKIFTKLFCLILFLMCNDKFRLIFCNNSTEPESIRARPIENVNSVNEWFNKLNVEYKQLLYESSTIAWRLILNSFDNEPLIKQSVQLDLIKLKWKNLRCSESRGIINFLKLQHPEHSFDTSIKLRMLFLLCRGPMFTEYQAKQLNKVLSEMSDFYSLTRICVPQNFDVCKHVDSIWDLTYVQTQTGDYYPLLLDYVKPDMPALSRGNYIQNRFYQDRTNLTSDDYFVHDTNINFNPNTEFLCFNIEPDLESVMTGDFAVFNRPDCSLHAEVVLRWAWESWRMVIASKMPVLFAESANLLNIGAKNAGYNNIGDTWVEENELQNLDDVQLQLWAYVKPFYKLLHGAIRSVLKMKYPNLPAFESNGPIPAHLFGNMWSSSWETYSEQILANDEINLDAQFANKNWSIYEMVRDVDDFYVSLGLKKMNSLFWENSVFEPNDNLTSCHGTAANMNSIYGQSDYRMVMCAKKSINDFYVMTHEIGHIQYYWLSEMQPPIFQDGASTAFQESIGDAVFYGLMTPQHLNRIRIIPDKFLYPNKIGHKYYSEEASGDDGESVELKFLSKSYPNIEKLNERKHWTHEFIDKQSKINMFDITLLLRMALMKIPQIPFEYIMDKFRLDYFNGAFDINEANNYFWSFATNEQGIMPPGGNLNREQFFDIGSKFHFAYNIPYTRYFLASFLQTQIFRGLCRVTVFGTVKSNEQLPMPLHRCDIYGSKRAGKLLKKALALGSSTHWSEVLYILTGEREIDPTALIEYYQPLISWLEQLVVNSEIPIGW